MVVPNIAARVFGYLTPRGGDVVRRASSGRRFLDVQESRTVEFRPGAAV
jgi:hypothetical protein